MGGSCPHSTYGVYTQQRMRGRVTVSGADRMTKDEFGMHDVPRCLDNQGDKTSRCRAERGTESKEAEAHLAGYSRRVTPLAFIHRRVRPLDGWMVLVNSYSIHAGEMAPCTGQRCTEKCRA